MKKSPLSLVLSLTALLGTALLLPQGAAAHDKDGHYRGDRNHYQTDHIQDPQRHYRGSDVSDWHLLRHRELRQHGYRPLKRLYRIKGKKHGHRHHHHGAHRHHSHRLQRHGQRQNPPVQLEVSYHIVL
jgi:hypothetical protein